MVVYLSSSDVVCIFFLACGRIEDNVVNGLNELELNDALDKQMMKGLVLVIGGHLKVRDLGACGVLVLAECAANARRAVQACRPVTRTLRTVRRVVTLC